MQNCLQQTNQKKSWNQFLNKIKYTTSLTEIWRQINKYELRHSSESPSLKRSNLCTHGVEYFRALPSSGTSTGEKDHGPKRLLQQKKTIESNITCSPFTREEIKSTLCPRSSTSPGSPMDRRKTE